MVRRIQEARKASGLAVTDRISLRWSAADGELADALAAHGALIADEVLAETFEPGEPPAEEPVTRIRLPMAGQRVTRMPRAAGMSTWTPTSACTSGSRPPPG